MKKLIFTCAVFGCSLFAGSQTQIVDMRTGIDDNLLTPIPYGSNDDTWEVQYPGSPTFQSLSVQNVVPWGYPASNVEWISPLTMPSWSAQGGLYTYRMEFDFNPALQCFLVNNASFFFDFIAGDDNILQVSVNGNTPHPINAGFVIPNQTPPPWTTSNALPYIQNLSIPISPNEIVAGTNYIELTLYNYSDATSPTSPTMINVDGNLTINYGPGTIPINLQGSSSLVCNGGIGFISAGIPSYLNPANYVMNIYELPSNNLVYSGAPNLALMVSPQGNGPVAFYQITITDTTNGCVSSTTHAIEIDYNPFVIDITGTTDLCPGSSGIINLYVPNGLSGYSMTVSLSNTQIYSGPAMNFPITQPGQYVFNIKDNATGCISSVTWQVNSYTGSSLAIISASSTQCINYGPLTANGFSSVGQFSSHSWTIQQCTSLGIPMPGGLSATQFGFGQPGVVSFSQALGIICGKHYLITLKTIDICGLSSTKSKVILAKCCSGPPPPPPGMVQQNNRNREADQFDQENQILDGNELSIYPNPTSGLISIEYVINENSNGAITIIDVTGRVVKTQSLSPTTEKIDVDLSQNVDGIYFVQLFENNKLIKMEKLILSR